MIAKVKSFYEDSKITLWPWVIGFNVGAPALVAVLFFAGFPYLAMEIASVAIMGVFMWLLWVLPRD